MPATAAFSSLSDVSLVTLTAPRTRKRPSASVRALILLARSGLKPSTVNHVLLGKYDHPLSFDP